jgi:hypothetical protein
MEDDLIYFLQTGQRLVQESFDGGKTMLHTANATGTDTIIPAGLVRIRKCIHSDMITDEFVTDVLGHIGTLRDLLGRVKTLYDKRHPTYKELEDFEKGCDTMSGYGEANRQIRAAVRAVGVRYRDGGGGRGRGDDAPRL